MMQHKLKFRPFECFPENEAAGAVIKVTGVIDGDTFLVSGLGYKIPIETESIEEDELGPFVMVPPQKRELGEGWFFEARLYADDPDEPPGAEIRILQFNSAVERLAIEHRLDLNKVFLINPPRAGFTVNFNWLGRIDGVALISTVPHSGLSQKRLPS